MTDKSNRRVEVSKYQKVINIIAQDTDLQCCIESDNRSIVFMKNKKDAEFFIENFIFKIKKFRVLFPRVNEDFLRFKIKDC